MNNFHIDDITWNDLSMEDVYQKINSCSSSVGDEYLKKILRSLCMDETPVKERSERADHLELNPDVLASFQKVFRNLGKTKKISLYDYIFRFHELKPAGNTVHYILIILLLLSIALIFINPVAGIIAVVVMFAINISTYFKYKAQIEGYFMCFKYITRMLKAASVLTGIIRNESRNGKTPFDTLSDRLDEVYQELKPLKRGSWLLTNSVSGSLVDVIMDYVRMLFHVDIIKFNNMRKLAADRTGTIDNLFCVLGEIESDICICLYRKTLESWCRPSFTGSGESSPDLKLHILGMYHPLTQTIVKNDIDIRKPVLLTGSNASGKSTFLKQLAINQIFAQTLYTCLADEFETGFYKVISSMALADNILGEESYFIVEIKSLKRIFDESAPVMCFIDEVLRGTNTKERVAASSQILKNLSERGTLCFAATHDFELTQLLEEYMDNYHFREYVKGSDIEFDYKIKPGAAVSRNAILLMKNYGFDPSITDAATAMAEQIEKS